MTTISFDITFHQPFLVASGYAGSGLDSTGVIGRPVPASSLKGAMRHAALAVLHLPPFLVDEVFGAPRLTGDTSRGAAWAWNDVGPVDAFDEWSRTRNRIDPETGAPLSEALVFASEMWQRANSPASFAIDQIQPLSRTDQSDHAAALRMAAFGVTALGGGRNRSMGTVTIRPSDSWDPAELGQRLDRLRSEGGPVR